MGKTEKNTTLTPNDALKKLREQAGLSQRELAVRFRIDQSQVSLFETGRRALRLEFLASCADQIGFSLVLVPHEALLPAPSIVLQPNFKARRVPARSPKQRQRAGRRSHAR